MKYIFFVHLVRRPSAELCFWLNHHRILCWYPKGGLVIADVLTLLGRMITRPTSRHAVQRIRGRRTPLAKDRLSSIP